MDMTIITQLISSLGFPIAACIYMAWAYQRANERHKEEIDQLRASVDNNTKVMIKLCAKLGVDVD